MASVMRPKRKAAKKDSKGKPIIILAKKKPSKTGHKKTSKSKK